MHLQHRNTKGTYSHKEKSKILLLTKWERNKIGLVDIVTHPNGNDWFKKIWLSNADDLFPNMYVTFLGALNIIGEIAFENVKSLSYDMHEILENADMACEDLRVYNIKELNYENSFFYAMKYKEIVADPVFVITGVPEGGTITWIHLYSEDEDSNEKYYFKFYSDNPDELVRSMY